MRDDLLTWCAEQRAIAERAAPSPWEWGDCFNPESDDCGLLQVRIPSLQPWDADGFQYITIGDMEWVESREFNTAKHIATFDPTTVTVLLAVVEAGANLRQAYAAWDGLYRQAWHRGDAAFCRTDDRRFAALQAAMRAMVAAIDACTADLCGRDGEVERE